MERAILAALFVDPSYLSDLDGQLSEEDFTEGPRRHTYATMLELHRKGVPVDLVSVANELTRRVPGASAVHGGLAALTSHPGTPSHLISYAARLRSIRTIEHLRLVLVEGIDSLGDCAHQPDAVSALVTDLSLRVESHVVRVERSVHCDLRHELERAFEEMRQSDVPPGISSGFWRLDDLTHGLRPGKLVVVAGRPGMGKSAMALNIARSLAGAGHHTLLFSLEMLRGELVQRLLAAEADVDLSRILGRRLNQDEVDAVQDAILKIREIKLTLCDEPNVSPAYLRATLRRTMKTDPVECVVVDYLQIMAAAGKTESRHLEIGGFTRELKRVAQEFQIPVIAVSMLSRQVESRDKGAKPHYPRLSDLRESGSIEQDADTVLLLYRPHYYAPDEHDPRHCEVIVAKNRGGRTDSFNVLWDGSRTKFTSAEEAQPVWESIPLDYHEAKRPE